MPRQGSISSVRLFEQSLVHLFEGAPVGAELLDVPAGTLGDGSERASPSQESEQWIRPTSSDVDIAPNSLVELASAEAVSSLADHPGEEQNSSANSKATSAHIEDKANPKQRRGKGTGTKPSRQARTLTMSEFEMVSEHVETHSPNPESGLVVLELAFSAAFRPIEIANLLTRNVKTGSGELSPILEVMPGTSKWGKGRRWPWSLRLKFLMERLITLHPAAERVAFNRRVDGTYDYWNAQKVGKWIGDMCRAVGLEGCSGMSGRRTAGTRLAAEALRAGRPVEDVQAALGHSQLSTTQFYLEPTSDVAVLEAAVRMLGRTNHREWKAQEGIDERQGEIRHVR